MGGAVEMHLKQRIETVIKYLYTVASIMEGISNRELKRSLVTPRIL